jgi:hypothetical protein
LGFLKSKNKKAVGQAQRVSLECGHVVNGKPLSIMSSTGELALGLLSQRTGDAYKSAFLTSEIFCSKTHFGPLDIKRVMSTEGNLGGAATPLGDGLWVKKVLLVATSTMRSRLRE